MIEPRYEAEVWGGDAATSVHLGAHAAVSRRLLLFWLRRQALRLADGIDPDPARGCFPGATRVVTPVPGRDAPTVLRRWAADVTRQEETARRLAAGLPFRLAVQDGDGCWYALTARQVCRRERFMQKTRKLVTT
ncbi:hypothetical protein [Streptomyces avicenniae]|uniref:hypothetical protein n=1 Tax=Streptomyces avicenniae TaxID=500153 RepID=UPI00069B63EF|nr:hypothetical protein [Streptomyces avicenniae]